MPKINFLRLLQVFMALMPIVIEGFYGMNWLVCLVGGTCLGALCVCWGWGKEISMSLSFLVIEVLKIMSRW
jgi:hypothetical protein